MQSLKTVQRFLEKLKMKLPYDPAIPFLSIYADPFIHNSNTHNSQDTEITSCPLTGREIKEVWCEYAMEYYSAIKRSKMSYAATWIDPEIIILSKASQKEKLKYHTISLICGV